MFTVKVEQLGNALSITYGGRVTPAETRLCSEEVSLALNILKPGFRLLVDLTELETMDRTLRRPANWIKTFLRPGLVAQW